MMNGCCRGYISSGIQTCQVDTSEERRRKQTRQPSSHPSKKTQAREVHPPASPHIPKQSKNYSPIVTGKFDNTFHAPGTGGRAEARPGALSNSSHQSRPAKRGGTAWQERRVDDESPRDASDSTCPFSAPLPPRR